MLLLLVAVSVLGIYRWEKILDDDPIVYKKDRWNNQLWAEFYPPNALMDSPIAVPLIQKTRFSDINEVGEHLKTHALSGKLVEKWVVRTRLTDLYMGVNSFLVVLLVIVLGNSYKRKHYRTRDKT